LRTTLIRGGTRAAVLVERWQLMVQCNLASVTHCDDTLRMVHFHYFVVWPGDRHRRLDRGAGCAVGFVSDIPRVPPCTTARSPLSCAAHIKDFALAGGRVINARCGFFRRLSLGGPAHHQPWKERVLEDLSHDCALPNAPKFRLRLL
jgi:hypothetical protein